MIILNVMKMKLMVTFKFVKDIKVYIDGVAI